MFPRRLILLAVVALGIAIERPTQAVGPGPSETDAPREAEKTVEPPPVLALPEPNKLTELDQAYLDSYSILKQNNSCSAFFGGPVAISALNELFQAIKPTTLDRRIGFKMEGVTMTVVSAATNFQYRMFPKVEVNLNGAFYKKRGMPGQPSIPIVGAYMPGTREARVALLLHELGHLIRKPNGEWLLRDDGKDESQSVANTGVIVDACRDQIRERQHFTFKDELTAAQPKPSLIAEGSKRPVHEPESTDRFVPLPGRFVPN